MGDRKAKSALYDGFALVARGLANGRRTEIVEVLAQGERSVEDVAGEIGQSVANTSQHLQHLLKAGLVATRREGNRIYYSPASDRVLDLWSAMQDVAAAHVGELDGLARAYLGDRSKLETIGRQDLSRRLRSGDIVVVDVRPTVEYDAGHIDGAVSMPIGELTRRLRELPKLKRIVAYCRGPYCAFADDAVRTLRRRGYRAQRLEDGFPQWAAEGLPVAQTG